MQTRTWPYGTEKTVTVKGVDPRFVICIDQSNEGYVMMFVTHDINPVLNERVVVQFQRGGPAGGYWKIVRRHNVLERSEMNVRCKMKCVENAQLEHCRRIKFSAVCADEVPENQRFHKYTPTGSIEIQVTNPDVNYEVGKSYYFDSIPVET